MATYTYPTSQQLTLISQDLLPTYLDGDPIFDLFPMVTEDAALLAWDQRDNYQGLAAVRGYNGEPPKVKRVGHKRYQMVPGVYGEFVEVDELEITTRRQVGTYGDPIDITDLITEAQEYLQQREVDRVRKIIWDLFTTGTFSVSTLFGQAAHADTYPLQTFSAGVPWATFATATPLANFRSVQLLSRGHSVNFGAVAQAFMNRTTFNNMISNTNQADLAGRRAISSYLSVLNLEEVNKVYMGEDLPMVVIYDRGYIDESNNFQLFIPNAKVVVIGQRPNNEPVGEYAQTRNANNPDVGAGSYTMVQDSADQQQPPRKLRVHRGHNGGPKIGFPSAIVTMSV